jgi:hypothetical protein
VLSGCAANSLLTPLTREAALDQDAEETVPVVPSQLATAQALRGLPAIAKGVSGTQRGTQPGHGSPSSPLSGTASTVS